MEKAFTPTIEQIITVTYKKDKTTPPSQRYWDL